MIFRKEPNYDGHFPRIHNNISTVNFLIIRQKSFEVYKKLQ